MTHQKNLVEDNDWPEVRGINNFAIFMGYLLMGVRGLGFLVLTWTTVVLLGGFVSMLQRKDFWCLTAITLVQTAGVFDFLLKEKASDLGNSLQGLLVAVGAAVVKPFKKGTNASAESSKISEGKEPSVARLVVATVLFVVQVLMLAIVLCPLAMLYMLGLYLSTGISLWRLIQHDYGNPDGGANLKPALNVLYSLAVAQGVVYGYRTIYDLAARTAVAQGVAKVYSLETNLVSEYLEETVEGCMKDPSFARGRNLVAYAVDLLIDSKSRYGYISGVLILGKVILERTTWPDGERRSWPDGEGQSGLMRQLLSGSVSYSLVHRLLETFGPTSPYSTEIRVRAARIVATIAGSIRLDHFPDQGMMMIQCISSLLDTFEEYSWRPDSDEKPWYMAQEYERRRRQGYERHWLLDEQEDRVYQRIDRIPTPMASDSQIQGYRGLVVQGLCILRGLVLIEGNCRIICNDQDLLSKAMSPLLSDRFHGGDHHVEWCSMAEESLKLMRRLMATPPGETQTKLRNEISSHTQSIIRTVKFILECPRCQVMLKRQAVEVLIDLSMDTQPLASIMPGRSSRTIFVWILLHIALTPDHGFDKVMYGSAHFVKKSSEVKRLAGKKLHIMLSSETSTLRSVGDVIGSLARTVVGTENNAYRIHAATILKHLCERTKDDETLMELKKAVTNVMPEVLQGIVHGTTTEEIQVVTQANNGSKVLLIEGPDLEQGGSSHDNNNGLESSTTHQQAGEQHQGIQLQEALIDLCWGICWGWIRIDGDLDWNRQFDKLAAKICSEQGMPDETFITLVAKARYKLEEEKKRL